MGDPKYREYADDIHTSGQRLLELINDILDLSRVESGRVEISNRAYSLKELLDEVLKTTTIRADERRIKTEVRFLSEIADSIMGAVKETRQVLLNLVNNAIKYAPEGAKVEIFIKKENDALRFTVFNSTNKPIPEETQRRLFETFVRGKDVASVEGAGIGLPLARKLVRAMDEKGPLAEKIGADLQLDYSVEGGTSFSFTIQYAPASSEAEAQA